MATKSRKRVNVDFLREDPEATASDLFAAATTESYPITPIAPARLKDNPYQPRQRIDPASIEELASVISSQGFQGALVARPHPHDPGSYQLAFGHRRREAARRAGLEVIPVVVKPLGEEEMVELAAAENIQREDLTALEEGRTFDMMVKVLGYTYEQIAAAIGKTRGYVENRLRVAWAPQDVQDLVDAKPDSLRAVATLIKIEDTELRGELIRHLIAGTLTTDDLPGYIEAARYPRDSATTPGAIAEEKPAFVADEPQPDPASQENGSNGHGDRTRSRTGYAQLSRALRAAARFQEDTSGREQITNREFIALTDLRRLVDELYERFSPSDLAAN